LLIRFGALLVSAAVSSGEVNVLTWHNDNGRTGQNLQETLLTPANVGPATFGLLAVLNVDGKVDAQPLYVQGVTIPNQGVRNVLYVATEHGSLYAFDADTFALLRQVSLIGANETPSDDHGCSQVTPEIGITATPAIDLHAGPSGMIYAIAMSKDGNQQYHQRLHALDLPTLTEQLGGPVEIHASYTGSGAENTFNPAVHKERPGLLITNGVVYTSWGSHCDAGSYAGWLLSYSETTLAQIGALNLVPNGNDGGIWAAGSGPASDATGNVFLLTGNGTFDTTLNSSAFPSNSDFGNAFVKISTSGTLAVADYFTMLNTVSESAADVDMGSGGLMLLPPLDNGKGTGTSVSLVVGAGKDTNIYILHQTNLGKFNPNMDSIYQLMSNALPGGSWSSPAWFNGNLYYGGVGDSLKAFAFAGGVFSLAGHSSNTFPYPGTTPSISANGKSNGIVWAVENSSTAVLHAYQADDVVTELYNSNEAPGGRDHFGSGNKFIVPTIANGKVFVGTTDSVGVFGLLQIAATITSAPPGVSFTASGTGCAPGTYTTPVSLAWSTQTFCTVSFGGPEVITGVSYCFQSSTVNGSATSPQNPVILNSGTTALTINATYASICRGESGQTTHFSVMPASLTATAGVPVRFTVTALTAGDTTDATYADPVHFTSTDASATLPGDMTLTHGVGAFSASLVTRGMQTVTASDPSNSSITGTSGNITVSAASGLRFVPVTPCRVADTRNPAGPFGAPYIGPTGADGQTRSFTIPNSSCGIPATAQSYSFNVTVVPHGSLGYVTVWPTGQTQPLASTLNSLDGRIKANAAIVPAGTGGAISVLATNDTDLILDINGYFVPATNASALALYPMAPCRLVDTRFNLLSSGALSADVSRTLPILSSSCNVPATAQAYSLNFTVVPPGTLGYLSVWPTGEGQPLVSTLNDLTGTIVANSAIVPAGTSGSIDVYATNTTDLVVDINGYFAPAGAGALSLYNLPPCRVLDTRNPSGSPPFTGSLDVSVIGSGCGGTSAAQGYVLNATVVPFGRLGYLTLWPQGAGQPTVSTLNAEDGAITNNMAIVPTNNTEISAYASTPNTTHLILDIAGYFAP
jgi:hypothetical protein